MTYRVNNLMYAAGPDLMNTFRIRITLTEPVKPKLLRYALRRASRRFPYFCVKLARRGGEYFMEPNALPFTVRPYGKAPVLGTEESNYHLFTFMYKDRDIFLDSVHYITDGNGVFPFLKSILYYYISALHPEAELNAEEFALAEDPVPAEEADDYPYPDEPLSEDPLGNLDRPEEVWKLEDQPGGYESMDGWTSFVYSIDQKDLVVFASGVDGSPATFVASMLYRSISDLYPYKHQTIVCGMQHQFRQALGKPRSHMCHVKIVPMLYPDSLRDNDIEMLNTVGRGILIIRADDSNDVLTVNRHIRNEKLIKDMTLAEKHGHMRREILDGIGENTFEVSYTGRVSWSGLEKYVKSVVPHLDMTLSGGISAEIFSVGDVFSLNIMQRSGVRDYAYRFEELLDEYGIDFKAERPEHFEICGFELPE